MPGKKNRPPLRGIGINTKLRFGRTATETPERSDDYMKKKKECRIGERAFEEVGRLFKSKRFAVRVLGISKSLLYDWKYETVPSAFYIAKIHYLGGDAMYILTGKRSIKNGEGGSGTDDFV